MNGSPGLFTEEQLFRINSKTLCTPLPKAYNSIELMALLGCVTSDNSDSEDAPQATTDWYCTSTEAEVQKGFDKYESTEAFIARVHICRLMHQDPEKLERAIEHFINKG